MAFHSATGLLYLPVRDATTFLHVPDKDWMADPGRDNVGNDVHYEGPFLDKWQAVPPPKGRLIAWNPVEQREGWSVTNPVRESGGVLATGGNLVFQGRGDGMFLAYRATDGKKLW